MTPYFLYILQCSDDTYYTGITTDVSRRIEEHNSSPKGAKYTRTRRPVTLLHVEAFGNKSDASRREYEVKRYSRKQKEALVGVQA